MIVRNRITEVKIVEQLTLVTLQTAHHGSTSPRIASTQRNHASRQASTDFCNKICQQQTHALQQMQRRHTRSQKPTVPPFALLMDESWPVVPSEAQRMPGRG